MTPREHAIALYRRALEKAADTGEEAEVERYLCQTDLFYLLVVVLGRKDVNNDWLFARCREVQAEPNGRLDLWAREHYKDLADDTPILTATRGWVGHGDLIAGDRVYDDTGRARVVLAVSERYTDSACRRLTFSDGAQIVCGAGHLWRVRQKHRLRVGDWQQGARHVVWDDQVTATDCLPPRADVGALLYPIEGISQQLPVDPYVLGAWLGDGAVGGTRITSALSDADEMEALLAGRGALVRRVTHSNAVSLRVGSGRRGHRASSDFANGLRALGVYRDKHIPACYLAASAHQRMMLLRGLMDTDGACDRGGTAIFCNVNRQLADGVYDLAAGLALRPRFRQYHHKTGPYKGRVFYQVAMQAHRDRVPFSMQRKADRAIAPSAHRNCRDVVSVEAIPSVPTRCIQVDGGIYLAGRELVPTHNSTIITFALTIQDILNDPEITVGIISFNRPTAKKFLGQIKREFEGNERLRALFPDVIWRRPSAEAPVWSMDEGIILKRKGNPKEATIEAYGLVDSQPISKHFPLIVYDDVVTRDSVTSPDTIEKVTNAWAESRALRTDGGVSRYVGTRWHHNDTYREIISRGSAVERRHAATDDGSEHGKPVLKSAEWLAEQRRDMGVYVFGAQMLLNPTAGHAQGFKEEWLRYHQETGDGAGMNKYILGDAASEKKKNSDYTALGVVGLGADNNYYLLDLVRDRLSLTERGDALFALHRRWKPMGVGYEAYGLMADIEYFQDRQRRENYHFEITKVGGQMPKPDRIKRLVPVFEQGRMYLPETCGKVDYEGKWHDLVQSFLNDEYRAFPVPAHDDMLDMLSRVFDIETVWPKAVVKDDRYTRARSPRRGASWLAA